ncbi:hypothetical protein [Halobacillus mangrovi]|uniref:hypothetical protein n=1 Tax=Halobacillus mangrovi TaxID=402384 RepID=UPI003D969988
MNKNQGWLTQLQSFVDQIISNVYQWPAEKRTTLNIMRCIEANQHCLNKEAFPTYGCYYIQLAQIIDHFLSHENQKKFTPELSWFCKHWETFECEQSLTLNHVIIEIDSDSLSFKKFVVHRKQNEITRYCQSALYCSEHMFHRHPNSIETFNLTNGQRYIEWSS